MATKKLKNIENIDPRAVIYRSKEKFVNCIFDYDENTIAEVCHTSFGKLKESTVKQMKGKVVEAAFYLEETEISPCEEYSIKFKREKQKPIYAVVWGENLTIVK
jgi:hypothetical protein